MKNEALGMVSALTIMSATSVYAADLSGEMSLDVTKNAAGDMIATPGIDLSIDGTAGFASIGLTVDSATDNVELDSYSFGATVGNITASFGDQGDIFDNFEGGTEVVGGTTLLNLDDSGESIQVTYGGKLTAGLRFTDIGSDITDVSALQLGYGTELGAVSVAAGMDYNIDTEDTSLFTKASVDVNGVGVSGTVSYRDIVAYELGANYGKFGAFVNGDENDMAQNIGGGIYGDITNTPVSYYIETGYNIDSEEITPALGLAFNF